MLAVDGIWKVTLRPLPTPQQPLGPETFDFPSDPAARLPRQLLSPLPRSPRVTSPGDPGLATLSTSERQSARDVSTPALSAAHTPSVCRVSHLPTVGLIPTDGGSTAPPASLARWPHAHPSRWSPAWCARGRPVALPRGQVGQHCVLCVPRVFLEFTPVRFPGDTYVLLPH